MVVLIGDVLSFVGFTLAVVFCAVYAWTADWRTHDPTKKEFIWHIMAWALVGTALDFYRTALIFVRKADPDWEIFRMVVYGAIVVVIAWRLRVLFRRDKHEDREHHPHPQPVDTDTQQPGD